jgi:hypothetical protein
VQWLPYTRTKSQEGAVLKFTYKKGLVEITEIVGGEDLAAELSNTDTDIVLKMNLLLEREEARRVARCQSRPRVCLLLPSYVIDLTDSEEGIFRKINKSTRRNINKAIKRDDLRYVERTNPSDADILEFGKLYDQFASEVGIKKCDVEKLKSIRDQGGLTIASVLNKTDTILCAHAYLIDNRQAYGMYSVLLRSLNEEGVDGQLIGMANKYLDWRNIKKAKGRGCKWYNFGGKIMDPSDKKGEAVNQYKLAFGSSVAYDFRVYSSKSLLGNVFVILLHFYYIWKRKHEYAFTREVLEQY